MTILDSAPALVTLPEPLTPAYAAQLRADLAAVSERAWAAALVLCAEYRALVDKQTGEQR